MDWTKESELLKSIRKQEELVNRISNQFGGVNKMLELQNALTARFSQENEFLRGVVGVFGGAANALEFKNALPLRLDDVSGFASSIAAEANWLNTQTGLAQAVSQTADVMRGFGSDLSTAMLTWQNETEAYRQSAEWLALGREFGSDYSQTNHFLSSMGAGISSSLNSMSEFMRFACHGVVDSISASCFEGIISSAHSTRYDSEDDEVFEFSAESLRECAKQEISEALSAGENWLIALMNRIKYWKIRRPFVAKVISFIVDKVIFQLLIASIFCGIIAGVVTNHFTTKNAPLREEPNRSSDTILIVEVNTHVNIIQSEPYYYRVWLHDSNDEYREGWVYKGCVKCSEPEMIESEDCPVDQEPDMGEE